MDNNHEPDMCYQVFALAFKQEGAIDYFVDNLPKETLSMSGKGHAEFYEAICDFYSKTGSDPIDKIAFRSWLENETAIYEALGGKSGVTEYISLIDGMELSTPQVAVSMLRHRYNKDQQKRKVNELVETMAESLSLENHTKKVGKLAEEIRDLNHGTADPLSTIHDGKRIAGRAEALWELPDFVSTQFTSLNRAMGYSDTAGFCKGAVHAILAASGQGKSSLAKSLMNFWVESGLTVLYVNYEEAIPHWERVLFTQVTKQNVYMGDKLNNTQKKHYTELFRQKMEEWDGRFLVKHDPDTPYFEDLESWLRDIHRRGKKLDVIIIDTIQSMFLRGGKSLPRWGQYEEMMVRLEKLAKDIGAVLIITAQENSNRMKEKREVVQQSDIGGSLAIAQKSSVTIFITRAKAETDDDAMDEHIMQLQIPKNRITGVTYMMDPPLVKYNDATKSYENIPFPSSDRYESSMETKDFERLY